MKNTRLFIPYWIAFSAILYLAPLFLGNLVVVGNVRLSTLMASVISGFILALAQALIHPALHAIHIHVKNDWEEIVVGIVVNILALWFIARYADLTGVGMASFILTVGMGILLYGVEWVITAQFMGKHKKR